MATIPMETENQHEFPDQVTVLIPHFQTLEAIRLCLRSIRYYTPQCLKVRVLDNGSKDDSIDYLRSVKWIELVPTGIPNDTWTAHFQALNRAVADVQTPFFLIMHPDTFVCNHRWLDFLMDRLNARGYAAVGSRSQCVIRCRFKWLRQMFTPTRRRELNRDLFVSSSATQAFILYYKGFSDPTLPNLKCLFISLDQGLI